MIEENVTRKNTTILKGCKPAEFRLQTLSPIRSDRGRLSTSPVPSVIAYSSFIGTLDVGLFQNVADDLSVLWVHRIQSNDHCTVSSNIMHALHNKRNKSVQHHQEFHK